MLRASSAYLFKMKNQQHKLLVSFCREEGIRTLDTLLAYTHFPGVRLRPLGHLSSTFLKSKCCSGFEWGANYGIFILFRNKF